MLKRQNRLKKAEFQGFSGQRYKTIKTSLADFKIYPPTKAGLKPEERVFSVVVSKKVSNRAVDRNLVKRRFYEVIRANLAMFGEGKYVFYPKKESLNSSTKEISDIIFN